MRYDAESKPESRSVAGAARFLLLAILILGLLSPFAACKRESANSEGKHPYRKAMDKAQNVEKVLKESDEHRREAIEKALKK